MLHFFIVKDVSLYIQIETVLDLDILFVSQWGDERLLDHGHLFAIWVFDFHCLLDGQPTLLYLTQLVSIHILENERFSQAQCLAVHFEDFLAVLVLDPEIIADGEELLADFVAGGHRISLSLLL